MDFSRPVRALIPGAQGRLLNTLAGSTGSFTIRTLASVSGVSPAQAVRIIPRLVELGIVTREEHPPVSLIALADDHIVGKMLRELADARERVIEHLRQTAKEIRPRPAGIALFGSFARGTSDIDSDIDVLVARSPTVSFEDDHWTRSVGEWEGDARRFTGNTITSLEYDANELIKRLRSKLPFLLEAQRDAILLLGDPFSITRSADDTETGSTRSRKKRDPRVPLKGGGARSLRT